MILMQGPLVPIFVHLQGLLDRLGDSKEGTPFILKIGTIISFN